MKLFILLTLPLLLVVSTAAKEIPQNLQSRILLLAPAMDADGDGTITIAELNAKRDQLPAKYQRMLDAFNNGEELSAKRQSKRGKGEKKSGSKLVALGLKGEQNIAYKNSPTNQTTLDIIYPQTKKYEKAPLVIFIHGGSYVAGNKNHVYRQINVIKSLLEKGIAVASIDYRLAKKQSAVFMNQINQDCKDALRFLAQNSDRFGVDPHKFITWGQSAGGSLALITALTEPGFLPGDVSGDGIDHTVVGAISYAGVTSFVSEEVWESRQSASSERTDAMHNKLFAPNSGLSTEEILDLTSPDKQLTEKCPPLLLVYGEKDPVVPAENGRFMYKIAKAKGVDVNYKEIKNAGHSLKSKDASISSKQLDQIVVSHILKCIGK